MADLVSAGDIAAMLGVTPRTVQRYAATRPDFPKPAGETTAGRVWRDRDVEKWAKANLPLRPGRPRKPETGSDR